LPTKRRAQTENRAPELSEEIQRIQALLRRLDGTLAQKDEVTLKDLAQAVSTAGAGGRSIAQLRKFEKELELAVQDEDYEQARKSMFAMIDKLRRRRKANRPADEPQNETPDECPHPPG
jgi:hypothetical protein